MKSKVLALLIPALLAAGAAHAAEVYNKDGNKLDLYGKVDGLHYFSDNSAKDGDQSYAHWLRSMGIQYSGKQHRIFNKPVMDPSGICRTEICRLRFFRLRT